MVASAGPTIPGQASRSCARLAGNFLNALRVMDGTTAAIGWGPWEFRRSGLGCGLESMGARMFSKIPPILESVGGVGVYGRLDFGNCRPGWPQDHASVSNFHASLRICGHREGQTVDEMGAEPPESAKSSTKLRVERRPADFHVPL
jgi:hypothetical protein